MVESVNKASSGAELVSSGASESTNESNVTSGTEDSANKHIAKVLKEKDHWRALAKELQDKDKAREEQELLSTKQHEKVIQLQKEELTKKDGELIKFKTRETEGRKSLAILSELKKLGFVDNETNKDLAMKLFDKSNVEIDPTANIVIGADISAKTFYDKYNQLGLFGKQSVGVNQNAPQGVMQKLTLDEWKKLSPEDKIKRRSEITTE